jgi:hypothetical protein
MTSEPVAADTSEAMHRRCICRDLRNGFWRTWFVLGNGSKPTAEPLPPDPACRPNLHPRHAGRCVGPLRSCAYMTLGDIDRRQASSACWLARRVALAPISGRLSCDLMGSVGQSAD